MWGGEHEITSVEYMPYIAEAYAKMFPQDTLVVDDAHDYLLKHFQEFDFIWSSPPCPTHSKLVTAKRGWGIYEYPDMKLYQEIIFLKHTFRGRWVVENVEPYYGVLMQPTNFFDRHMFWSNFPISKPSHGRKFEGAVTMAQKEKLAEAFDIKLPEGTKDQRKLLRNAVDPKLGLHILNAALKETKQEAMFDV